jgi:hypothetical protein
MSKIYGSVSLVIISMVVPVYAQDSVEIEEEVVVSESEVEEVVLDPSAPRSTRPACFSVRRINSFSAFHDEYIYIQDRGSRHYLLTMHRGCFGLRSARDIAIQNHTDRVCSNSQAEVSYRGPGARLEKCFIRTVEAVEDRAAARALVESRARR